MKEWQIQGYKRNGSWRVCLEMGKGEREGVHLKFNAKNAHLVESNCKSILCVGSREFTSVKIEICMPNCATS